jgi:hypothetical protein
MRPCWAAQALGAVSLGGRTPVWLERRVYLLELGAISTATQAVARLLRLSKTARLEASVGRYAKLYAQLQSQDGLEEPAKKVGALIDFQVHNLVGREALALTRVYDWGSFVAAVFCAAIVASPVYWLWTQKYWWSHVLAIFLGLIALLFVAVGISSVRKTPDSSGDEEPSSSPPEHADETSANA